jgi:AAA domain
MTPVELVRSKLSNVKKVSNPSHPTFEIIEASSLMAMHFPDPKWAVEGLLPEGATILAAKPKQGKSWLALNIALAVAEGGIALGKIATEAGDVLYLALEDVPRRLQGRLKMMLSEGQTGPSRLHFCTTWPRLEEGGTDYLSQWLENHPDARLIVIDTLARIRGASKRQEDLYARDYETIGMLKAVADEYSVAILIIHHERKSEAEDPFDSVSGTLGLTGAADAVLVLKRKRGTSEGILHITGRDIEESDLALRFDPQYGLWQIHGDAATVLQSRESQSIIDLLTRTGPQRPVEIAALLKEKQPTIRSRLMRMADAGLVKKVGNNYTLSDTSN